MTSDRWFGSLQPHYSPKLTLPVYDGYDKEADVTAKSETGQTALALIVGVKRDLLRRFAPSRGKQMRSEKQRA